MKWDVIVPDSTRPKRPLGKSPNGDEEGKAKIQHKEKDSVSIRQANSKTGAEVVVMFHFVRQTLSKEKEQLRKTPLWIVKRKSSLFQVVRHEHMPLCKNGYSTYSKNMQYAPVHVFTQYEIKYILFC